MDAKTHKLHQMLQGLTCSLKIYLYARGYSKFKKKITGVIYLNQVYNPPIIKKNKIIIEKDMVNI